MAAAPWQPESFDLPADPTDVDLRRAFRVLLAGGSLGGDALWSTTCARTLNDLGPDPSTPLPEAVEAYERAAQIFAKSQPPRLVSGILNKAGRGLYPPKEKPRGRVGDVIPVDATDDEIRQTYSAGDAEAIIKFRSQLNGMGSGA